jgi:peptidoglycan hydrolase CwlO-like protein
MAFFGYKYYTNDGNRELIKKLQEEENQLIQDRKIIKNKIDSIQKQNEKLVLFINQLEKKVVEDVKKIDFYKNKAKKSQQDINTLKNSYEHSNKDIEYLKQNPPNRTNDSLLKSLRNHIN